MPQQVCGIYLTEICPLFLRGVACSSRCLFEPLLMRMGEGIWSASRNGGSVPGFFHHENQRPAEFELRILSPEELEDIRPEIFAERNHYAD